MKIKKRNAYAAILLTILIWGISLTNIKITLEYYNPISISFWMFAIATAILFILKKVLHPHIFMDNKDRKTFLLAGGTGIFLYFTFQNTGLNYISASLTSILLGLVPIFTMIVEAYLFKNKLNNTKVFAVFLSVIGISLIVGFETGNNMKNIIIGSTLLLGSIISWLVYTFATRSLYQKYSPIVLLYYQSLTGTTLLGLLMPFNWSNPLHASVLVNFNLIYLGVFNSAIAYLMYNYALANLSPTVCNIFINLLPAVSITAGVVILGEKVSVTQIVGVIIVLTSVYFTTREPKSISNRKAEKVI